MLGFGITNLNIVKPCVDVFNPKVVRASMGAIFSMNIELFNSIEDYKNINKNSPFVIQCIKVMKMFYVYILKCADGTLYCGYTNDTAKKYLKPLFGDFPKEFRTNKASGGAVYLNGKEMGGGGDE